MNTPGKWLPWPTALAGALPMLGVLLAWQINLAHGFENCNPFTDGCTSVSRAVRSGPGLAWFKALALPAALCMAWAWAGVSATLAGRTAAWVKGLGWLSALALAAYALALGGDGAFYAWMRRYGVVLYFGGCGVAQLLVAARLAGSGRAESRVYAGVATLSWLLGIVSASRRQLVDDPQLQDRLQNALEWYFSACLSLGMVALAFAMLGRGRAPMKGGT